MKKILLSSAALLMLATVSFAQVNIGAKAGINAANIKSSGGGTTTTYTTLVGLNIGAFAEIPVSDEFIIQPELAYSQMGAKSGSDKTKLNYINITALAKYMISGFGVYAGPQLGILTTAKAESGGVTTDVKQYLKGADFAAILGVEYNFDPGIVLSARYQFGLANIEKNSTGGSTTKNNAFTATVGYKFVNNKSTKK